MLRYLVALTMAALIGTAIDANPAHATTVDSAVAYYKRESDKHRVNMEGYRGQLEETPVADWTEEMQLAYLNAANWTIYSAVIAYSFKQFRLPSKNERLSSGYLPYWPGNPYDEWHDAAVLSPDDPFTPGAFVLQQCPPSFYSGVSDPRPLSFQLSVYGPTADQPTTYAVPVDLNTWATVPRGTAFMLGSYTEPTHVTLRKREQPRTQEEERL